MDVLIRNFVSFPNFAFCILHFYYYTILRPQKQRLSECYETVNFPLRFSEIEECGLRILFTVI